MLDQVSFDAVFDAVDLPKQGLITAEQYVRKIYGLFFILFVYWYLPIHNQSQSKTTFLSIPHPLVCRAGLIFVPGDWQGPSNRPVTEYILWIRRFLSIFLRPFCMGATPLT
jgi:hypothetical protein